MGIIVLLLVLGYFFFGTNRPLAKRMEVAIRGNTFRAEVADNTITRGRGLSGRGGLAPDEGMLFIFGSAGNYAFWMKDMKFAIDIVWISDHKIVGIAPNVQPEPDKTIFNLTQYYPPGPVDKVLELPAGTAAKYGITEGDPVSFSDFSNK